MLVIVAVAAYAEGPEPPAEHEEEGHKAAREWLVRQRYPTGEPDPHAVAAAREAWVALPSITPEGQSWSGIGPAPLDTASGGVLPFAGPNAGRASAMAFDPADPDVAYA